MEKKIGSYAFIVGVIIAIIAAFIGAGYEYYITLLLLILGLIVGFMNITQKEAFNFLIATIALLAANAATQWTLALDVSGVTLGTWITTILGNISIFVAPAAVIVALKAIYDMAYKKL